MKQLLLRTSNGGETWIAQTSGLYNFLNDVFFIDINNGIIVCSGGNNTQNDKWW